MNSTAEKILSDRASLAMQRIGAPLIGFPSSKTRPIDIDTYIADTKERTEETDRAFILSLTDYYFQRNIDNLSGRLKLPKGFLRKWRQTEKEAIGQQVQGHVVAFEDVTPWPESVCGEELFNSIESQIRAFLIASDATPRIIALWCAMTFLVADLAVLPMLVFSSPVKRSGKTTALEITHRLSNRAIMASSITPAAIFRIVEKYSPTLLLDEADTVFRTSDDLRTLINASFTKNSAVVFRVQGNDLEPRAFSSFCPKALALIGHLPDTIVDRSIVVPMRRKKPGEVTDRLRADRDMGFSELRAMLARWILDNREEILEHDPDIPSSLNDRQADIFRELLRIADTIGGCWPGQIRTDAINICESVDDEDDLKTMLLGDIRSFFDSIPEVKQASSQSIVDYLITLEGHPWAELRNGRPITTHGLARMLHGFNIEPKTIRAGNGTPKGYLLEGFQEVFSRYLKTYQNTATKEINYMSVNDL
jgi:putative DNA primase/helicase